MSNQKRRVIYMTDQEWADLEGRAKKRGISASAYIRASVGGGFITPRDLLTDPAFAQYRPAPKGGRK
jgi:hypothetical protein